MPELDHDAGNSNLEGTTDAAEYYRQAMTLFDQGRYLDAYPLFGVAQSAFERQSGPDHPDSARCLCKLGRVAANLARYAAAREALERSRAIRERQFGLDHPETAESLATLGEVLFDLDERQTGLKLTELALDIRRRTLGQDHMETLESLKNQTLERRVMSLHGKDLPAVTAEAVTTLREALSLSERLYGDKQAITGRLANALALCLPDDEALPYAERALRVAQRALGDSHPETASRLANYALRVFKVGSPQQEQAIAWTREALQVHERAYGLDNPFTAIIQLQLAQFLKETNQTDEAQATYERALIALEHSLGAVHSLTLRAIGGLMLIHTSGPNAPDRGVAPEAVTLHQIKNAIEMAQGKVTRPDPLGRKPDPAQAADALHEFVARLEAKHRRGDLTEQHKNDLQEAERLGETSRLAFERGAYVEARESLERAVALREGALDPDDPGHVPLLERLIAAYKRLGKFSAVLPLQERITSIQQAAYGPMNPLTTMAQQRLYEIALADGQPARAEDAFKQMHDLAQGMFGADHPMLKTMDALQDARAARSQRPPNAIPLSVRQERALENITPSRRGALAGIDEIDWHGLGHAYGPADDVPMYLKLLLADDKDVEDNAWEYLYSATLHQGTIYPATAPTISVLVRMLAQGEPPDRTAFLAFLLGALGREYYEADEADDDELLDDEFAAPSARPDPDVSAAEGAVRAGLPVYLQLVREGTEETPEPHFLPALVSLLGSFKADAATISPLLEALRAQTKETRLIDKIDRAMTSLRAAP